ncbi:hypothetical protein [Scytonema sp. PRP1]
MSVRIRNWGGSGAGIYTKTPQHPTIQGAPLALHWADLSNEA